MLLFPLSLLVCSLCSTWGSRPNACPCYMALCVRRNLRAHVRLTTGRPANLTTALRKTARARTPKTHAHAQNYRKRAVLIKYAHTLCMCLRALSQRFDETHARNAEFTQDTHTHTSNAGAHTHRSAVCPSVGVHMCCQMWHCRGH